jgi:dGTPase
VLPMMRAPYASDPAGSRGRLHPETESATRTPFQRDRDRIIHSVAFRRLKHKTQVFVYHEGDHYRTRLTHSLEVAQIARSISRQLGLDEDLAEALALAHDLGHPPFGHAGEDALKACMAAYDGFDHNAQTLRIVTSLEQRYGAFDGLNLTWEALEGIVKHNGPLLSAADADAAGLPAAIRDYAARQDLHLHSYPSAEAQVAALSDDIAYNNHDIDDGLRAGLFRLEDMRDLPLVGELIAEVDRAYPGLERPRRTHELTRRLISHMIEDVIAESGRRLAAAAPACADDIRAQNRPMIAFSNNLAAMDRPLRDFLFKNVYRHFLVNRMISKAKRVVTDLFELFVAEPGTLPDEWQRQCDAPHTPRTARVVCDFIAGMTDRFALDEHRRLFDLSNVD